MKVKLLSLWIGPPPSWLPRFEAQMRRFETVSWELVRPEGGTAEEQVAWLNDLATARLGVACRKGHRDRNAVCDYRPAYAEMLPERYEGYDWWGWCDLDVAFGDLDRLLPEILDDGTEAVSFKSQYLSGCCAVFRNTERMRGLYRRGAFDVVLGDSRYHCWDESGFHGPGGEGFFHVAEREKVKLVKRPDLYLYDSPSERRGARWEDGRLFDPATGKEALLFHFMSDRWPEGV